MKGEGGTTTDPHRQDQHNPRNPHRQIHVTAISTIHMIATVSALWERLYCLFFFEFIFLCVAKLGLVCLSLVWDFVDFFATDLRCGLGFVL